MLAKRPTRRGATLSGGTLAAVLAQQVASAGVPNSVVFPTIKAANLLAAAKVTVAGAISVKVAALTEGVMKAMFLAKLRTAAMGLLLMVASLCTAAGLIFQTQAAEQSHGRNGPEQSKCLHAAATVSYAALGVG